MGIVRKLTIAPVPSTQPQTEDDTKARLSFHAYVLKRSTQFLQGNSHGAEYTAVAPWLMGQYDMNTRKHKLK